VRLSGVSKVGKQEASSNHGPMKHKYATSILRLVMRLYHDSCGCEGDCPVSSQER